MASLIDRIAQTEATLRVPTGEYLEGEPLFDDVPCRVFALGGERGGEEQFGQVASERKFLIAPDVAQEPRLPCRIVLGEKEYVARAVKPYVSMQGVLQGYRMEVANG